MSKWSRNQAKQSWPIWTLIFPQLVNWVDDCVQISSLFILLRVDSKNRIMRHTVVFMTDDFPPTYIMRPIFDWEWNYLTSLDKCWGLPHLSTRALKRVYNTFEKGQTHPSHSPSPLPSPLSPLLFFFLHKFLSFSLGKEKEFCLVLSRLALESTPFQFTPYPLSLPIYHLPSPFRPFPMCSQHLAGIFDSERTSSVPCKCRHKRKEASHLTPCD